MRTIPFKACGRDRAGFAIIVTVSILVLLAVVAVGLLTLSTVTVRGSQASNAKLEARANARLALVQAIGALQKYAGPDQRVTGSSQVVGDDVAQANWTGVWSGESGDSLPVWLVSGADSVSIADMDSLSAYPEGYQQPDESLRQPFVIHPAVSGGDAVEVSMVDIVSGGRKDGRFGWWVSDEGAKARVDLEGPDLAGLGERDRLAGYRSAQESAVGEVDERFRVLSDPAAGFDKESLITLETISAAISDGEVSPRYAHDLTVGGYGLPSNVVDGGLKTDLSILFDSTQLRNRLMHQKHLGAVPSRISVAKRTINYGFQQVTDPEKFYLAPELREGNDLPVGPNWGNLYNYGQLWRNLDNDVSPSFAMNPGLASDLRTNHWAPYSAHNAGIWSRDIQHTNSSVVPVLSFMQIGFRITARPTTMPGTNPPVPGYQLQLQMKPMLGFWNPYNVKLRAKQHQIQWYLYPRVRISSNTPAVRNGGQQIPRRWIRANIWLRDLWMQGSGTFARLLLDTPEIEFEPGEFRLFSVDTGADMQRVNTLVPTLSEAGGFNVDLHYSHTDTRNNDPTLPVNGSMTNGRPGEPIIVPQGSTVWFGGMILEDSVDAKTRAYHADSMVEGTASSSITVGAGEAHVVHRVSDIWQQVADTGGLPYTVPEWIQSPWGRHGSTNALPVESVVEGANDGSPFHIGTWRFFMRTATDAVGAQSGEGGSWEVGSQRIRNWIDSNPRFGPMNPVWDGSRIKDRQEEGFHFISPYIGGTYGESYDGGPSGRGKIAEGQAGDADAAPQVDNSGGRYRGFGGYSSSLAGQTHVTLFDVPRGPLVSLGQFQHAQLSRYGYEPALPFGNSHANIRIPLGQTLVEEFGGVDGFRMLDLSHSVNSALWDRYYFSTIGSDYRGWGAKGSLDGDFSVADLSQGRAVLPNPRHRFIPLRDDETLGQIVGRDDHDGPRAISSRIAIDGAFNVNSTSTAAWKAVLAGMADFEFPVLSQDGTSVSWEDPAGIRLPRFGHVMQSYGWEGDGSAEDPSFWNGFRDISADELDALAENIVKEVRERGPFRSMADFVNRDPESSNAEHQKRGALQAAIDRAVNADLAGAVGDVVEVPLGEFFNETVSPGESTAAGYAGYMMQGDVLQALAPVLQARSDYFRIRAVGQSVDASGKVVATEVCEAFVQRVAEYLDGEDEAHLAAAELQSEVNKNFGRRFKVVSFRWLSADELEG